MSFAALKLSSYLLNSLEKHGFKKPYSIQEQAIPVILDGKDVLGLAQTGSGKTASYVLPILMQLEKQPPTRNRHINVLVVVPTRELAIQVEAIFSQFGADVPFPFKSMAVFGGVSINPQMKAMSNVNVLVSTPGRLLELHGLNALHFSSVSTLILDEADKLLNLGFKAEMDKIFSLLPRKRQNLLFSATLSPDVKSMQQVLLNNPVTITIAPEQERTQLINQMGYFVKDEKKGPLLRYLIMEKKMEQVLVFTSSVYQADLVADKLQKNGISARAIHSKKSQGSRTESLQYFKQGEITVLVATDLLSRGIDIEFLPFVINYELPRSPKDFVHRIGRTGRAENQGEAITFVTEEGAHHFKVIQKKMKAVVTMIDSENLNLTGF
ncbi:MAG: DEAD/DEAH box helicase [Flavobacteriales bacterium]|nr:DEAD/DEAH box helicase [Flavobacteriales bacterium]